MSRIPQPSSSRSGIRPPSTPSKSRLAPPSDPVRTRTLSTPRATTPSKLKAAPAPAPPMSPSPGNTLSIKEAIALKRAEAKKAMAKSGGGGGGLDDISGLEDALPDKKEKEEEDLLGRLSIRETIEQARNTGSLNIATRSLPCLPSALFEIHLGLTPDALKSVPNEPVLPPSEPKLLRRGGQNKPAWFEAQDLTVLKAWNNDIQEVQHEISLFGSLKTIDLHKNKLTSLPSTFADLTSLTVLDLSHNALSSLPEKLFALPELTTLNLSYNLLTALPFGAPFVNQNGRAKASQQSSGGFFTPVVSHSSTPLPRLINLDASQNKIHAQDIDSSFPVSLVKIDLSGNPLGLSQGLLRSLSSLKKLKEIKFEKCEIGDDSFPPSLFNPPFFQALRLFNMSDTQVNLDSVKEAFKNIKQELNFDFSTEDPPEGVARILVGKRVMKESWELELERRANQRKAAAATPVIDDWDEPTLPARSTSRTSTVSPISAPKSQQKAPAKSKEVIKEAWEIEAEQGLLTEGGRRRARAAAAAQQTQTRPEENSKALSNASSSPTPTSPTSSSSLSSPQYFTQSTQTLKLPASAPPTKISGHHARAFSMATPSASSLSTPLRTGDLSVPTPTLPLSVIVNQPFADTLRVLILVNRRMDRSFALPKATYSASGFLPKLEELDLEGCNLNDLVPVHHASEAGASTPPRSEELLISTITKLFPSLRTLNLSYNALTNASLTSEALTALILAAPHRQGLRHLRLRGNRLSELDGFLELAEAFKGNRNVPEWKLEELDLRDNEIGKLPPELGLLPLDVFLVDGNTFRVPQRRVWEREGTKGLLSWLRGRIE
ncbi:L domain-like protein [Pholiota conissans]|uniref:L domain-like protein n=1 Tax=Pholiota conissans TaxID=109636 RepID=A0A9P5YUS3_9AGAR|nr:L domain-like protein [Pholiota conissans]